MIDVLSCWRCGASLAQLPLPLSRLDECPDCSNYLHVCRMCSYFDANVAKSCREDDAEEVKEKERANFCDYFKPHLGAYDAEIISAERKARGELDVLFGEAAAHGGATEPGNALKDAESLFGSDKKSD